MEIILNAAWLLIAIASYAFLARNLANRSPEHACGPGRFRSIIALSCVLAILFPVISLSDDLQEMQAAVAEVPPSQVLIKKFGVNHPPNPGKKLHPFSFLISSFISRVDWVSVRGITADRTTESVPSTHVPTPCRAPPSSDALRTTS